jgi:hypothetical protein
MWSWSERTSSRSVAVERTAAPEKRLAARGSALSSTAVESTTSAPASARPLSSSSLRSSAVTRTVRGSHEGMGPACAASTVSCVMFSGSPSSTTILTWAFGSEVMVPTPTRANAAVIAPAASAGQGSPKRGRRGRRTGFGGKENIKDPVCPGGAVAGGDPVTLTASCPRPPLAAAGICGGSMATYCHLCATDCQNLLPAIRWYPRRRSCGRFLQNRNSNDA